MNEHFRPFPENEPRWPPPAQSGAPATFTHPDDVVSDPGLTIAEKKAILASWSSDARAVENAPALRRLDSGAVVEVDAILRALVLLDEPGTAMQPPKWTPLPRPRSVISRWLNRAGRLACSNDNDDDPPPAPAGIAIPFRPTAVAAHGLRPQKLRRPACATG
jgi:hypothetical protein